MFTFANVVHFFANKFAGLSGRRFPLLSVAFGAFQRFLFRHKGPQKCELGRACFHRRRVRSTAKSGISCK